MDHLSKISQMIDLIFLLEDGIVLLSTLNSVLVVESCYFLVSLSPVPNNTDLPICHTCIFFKHSSLLLEQRNLFGIYCYVLLTKFRKNHVYSLFFG